MFTLFKSEVFSKWFHAQEKVVRARVDARLVRLEQGYFGDVKYLGGGVSELKFRFLSGIRVYFMRDGRDVIILLGGGDKGSQKKDVMEAQKLARLSMEK